MARSKTGTFDQTRYIMQYMKEKTTTKRVLFSNEHDSDILAWLTGKKFSTYVKELIRADMNKKA